MLSGLFLLQMIIHKPGISRLQGRFLFDFHADRLIINLNIYYFILSRKSDRINHTTESCNIDLTYMIVILLYGLEYSAETQRHVSNIQIPL